MKAVILSGTPSCRAGITDHLSVSEDIERPGVKADQVLVRVKATALNIAFVSKCKMYLSLIAKCICLNMQVLVRVRATALNIEDITIGAGE